MTASVQRVRGGGETAVSGRPRILVWSVRFGSYKAARRLDTEHARCSERKWRLEK